MKHSSLLALLVVTCVSVAVAQTPDLNAIHYGSTAWNPQTVAQERANHMARMGHFGHLGTGHVATSMGSLSEGIGWGYGVVPETCVATNGTAAIADATAQDGRGNIYRVRLYNSNGTMHPSQVATVGYGNGYTYAPYATAPTYTTNGYGYTYAAPTYVAPSYGTTYVAPTANVYYRR